MTIGVAQGLPGVQKKSHASVGISNRLLTSWHTRLRRPPRGPFSYQGVSTRGVRHSPGEKHINKIPPKMPGKFRENFVYVSFSSGKSHPWTNTSVGGNFRRTFRTIGPYEFPRQRYGPMIGPYEFPSEIRMDQWRSKFSESFSLDRYWSIECSSLLFMYGPYWTPPPYCR